MVPAGDVVISVLLDHILAKYDDIDPIAARRLCFVYHTHTIVTRRKSKEMVFKQVSRQIMRSDLDLFKNRVIRYPNPDGSMTLLSRPLELKDVHLRVSVPKGEERVKDVSCDSKFMLGVMDEIGKSIRSHYSFIPQETPVHLFMDNAGGHGKVEVKERYVQHL